LVVAFVCSCIPTLGQSIETLGEGTLNNEAIVSLTTIGLTDDAIVAKIQAAGSVDFRLETDDLVNLKGAGVSPDVVAAMITRQAAMPKSHPTERPLVVAPQQAPPKPLKPGVDLNFIVGLKRLENAWSPVDDQLELGAAVSIGQDIWPVAVAVDFLYTRYGGQGCIWYVCLDKPAKGRTYEVDAGVRKIWEPGRVLPYVGAGIGMIYGSFEITDGTFYPKSSDVVLGAWADMGVLFRPSRKNFEFGVDVRYSTADADIDFGNGPQSVNPGGYSFGLLFGAHF